MLTQHLHDRLESGCESQYATRFEHNTFKLWRSCYLPSETQTLTSVTREQHFEATSQYSSRARKRVLTFTIVKSSQVDLQQPTGVDNGKRAFPFTDSPFD